MSIPMNIINPMKKALYYGFFACLLGTLFFPAECAALFDTNPNDKSTEWLGDLFGAVIGPLSLGGAANPALKQTFETLNTVVVFLGVAVVSYVGVSSTINTAYEGEVLGKKLSTFWVPIRATLGILLMIPTAGSGYSLIQAFVMWIVLQGIGAANQVWYLVLDSVAQGFSTQGGIELSKESNQNLSFRANDLMENLLNSIVCIEGLKKIEQVSSGSIAASSPFYNDLGNPLAPSAFIQNEAANVRFFSGNISAADVDADQVSITKTYHAGIKNSAQFESICGSYEITGIGDEVNASSDSEDDRRTAAQNDLFTMEIGLTQLYKLLESSAKKIIANTDLITQDNFGLSESDPEVKSLISILKFSRVEYINILSALAIPDEASETRQQIVENGKSAGWALAGGLYAFLTGSGSKASMPNDTATYPNPIDVPTTNDRNGNITPISTTTHLTNGETTVLKQYLAYAKELYEKTDSLPKEAKGAANSSSNKGGSDIIAAVAGNIASLDLKGLMDDIGTNDPLFALKSIGDLLMVTAEISWIIMIQLSFGLPLIGGPPGLSGVVYALETFGMIIVTILTSILMMLWTVGALLAVYLPMIPFMIFTISVMGWFVAVIEAMVAAPILALSMTTPAGDELGKATSGLSILANVALRPTLMIFGFILASRLLNAAITFISFGISDILLEQTGNGAFYIFAFTAKLGLFTAIVISITNKCFGLIFILPNQILRFMGGQPEAGFGEEGIMDQARGKFDSASGTAGQALSGATQSAAKGLSARKSAGKAQSQ